MVKGGPRANAVDAPSPNQKGKGKDNGQVRKGYNKPSYEGGAPPLPPHCHQTTPQGTPIVIPSIEEHVTLQSGKKVQERFPCVLAELQAEAFFRM